MRLECRGDGQDAWSSSDAAVELLRAVKSALEEETRSLERLDEVGAILASMLGLDSLVMAGDQAHVASRSSRTSG